MKSKYWSQTHKFGIFIPKDVKDAKAAKTEDAQNGNNLWWEAICKEIKNVMIAFELHDESLANEQAVAGLKRKGYQQIDCHIIFDINMGENFQRKACIVAGGHKTSTPNSLIYSSVVSRDSVRKVSTIAALHNLEVLACDIQNAYLTAPCCEKIFTVAGPELDLNVVKYS